MTTNKLPSRLHHTAYVSKDLEKTRAFYEDVIGLPLVSTWCEKDVLFGSERIYCHCFFGLQDGSALAFFQFASDEDQKLFGPEIPSSPFIHIALHVDEETLSEIEGRIAKAGFKEPETYTLDHGYCRSVYIKDPDGMIVEFALDVPEVEAINELRVSDAHSELKRWLAGDYHSNNTYGTHR